jgi:hypothetical protein
MTPRYDEAAAKRLAAHSRFLQQVPEGMIHIMSLVSNRPPICEHYRLLFAMGGMRVGRYVIASVILRPYEQAGIFKSLLTLWPALGGAQANSGTHWRQRHSSQLSYARQRRQAGHFYRATC